MVLVFTPSSHESKIHPELPSQRWRDVLRGGHAHQTLPMKCEQRSIKSSRKGLRRMNRPNSYPKLQHFDMLDSSLPLFSEPVELEISYLSLETFKLINDNCSTHFVISSVENAVRINLISSQGNLCSSHLLLWLSIHSPFLAE